MLFTMETETRKREREGDKQYARCYGCGMLFTNQRKLAAHLTIRNGIRGSERLRGCEDWQRVRCVPVELHKSHNDWYQAWYQHIGLVWTHKGPWGRKSETTEYVGFGKECHALLTGDTDVVDVVEVPNPLYDEDLTNKWGWCHLSLNEERIRVLRTHEQRVQALRQKMDAHRESMAHLSTCPQSGPLQDIYQLRPPRSYQPPVASADLNGAM